MCEQGFTNDYPMIGICTQFFDKKIKCSVFFLKNCNFDFTIKSFLGTDPSYNNMYTLGAFV